MRHLSILLCACCLALSSFSQSSQTLTLVFASAANNSYKNYEAVIDDISYYSENVQAQSEDQHPGNRNTIWLDNVQPGQHTIQIYALKDGSKDERAGNTPVYSSTFAVKKGYDAKIAVRSNGQVQVSERVSAYNNNQENINKRGQDINTNYNNDNISDNNTSDEKMNSSGNASGEGNGEYPGKTISTSNLNDDTLNDNNLGVTERHSRKRIDTAIVVDNDDNRDVNTSRNKNRQMNSANKKGDSNDSFDDQNKNGNSKAPMDDNQFKQFYETVRNQWLPGQKMKTLTNEFLNNEDNFTTSQVKQLIQLINEEGNRLNLAKSSYRCITDPENFNQLDDVLRFKASREELNDYVRNGGD